MHRVLKPGGQALIIDLRRDASKESIKQAVDAMKLGFINRMLSKLIFRFVLLKRAYTKSDFEELISKTKFRDVQIREDLIGLEIWLSKDRATEPEGHLNAAASRAKGKAISGSSRRCGSGRETSRSREVFRGPCRG
jgi:hypothetical protein